MAFAVLLILSLAIGESFAQEGETQSPLVLLALFSATPLMALLLASGFRFLSPRLVSQLRRVAFLTLPLLLLVHTGAMSYGGLYVTLEAWIPPTVVGMPRLLAAIPIFVGLLILRLFSEGPIQLPYRLGFSLRPFLILAVPYGLLTTLLDATWFFPGFKEQLAVDVRFGTLVLLSMIVALLVSAPYLLKHLWPSVPLPESPTRTEFEWLCNRTGTRFRGLLVWLTHPQQIVNASVVGILSFNRLFLFTETLLQLLSPSQLLAVFAHEVGHVRRGHFRIFLLVLANAILVLVILGDLLNQASDTIAIGSWFAWLLVVAWLLSLLSRRLEYDADEYASHLVGPEIIIDTLKFIGQLAPHRIHRRGLRHPALMDRIQRIELRFASESAGSRTDFPRRVQIGLAAFSLIAVVAVFIVQGSKSETELAAQRTEFWLTEHGERARRIHQKIEPRSFEKLEQAATVLASAIAVASARRAPPPEEFALAIYKQAQRSIAELKAAN